MENRIKVHAHVKTTKRGNQIGAEKRNDSTIERPRVENFQSGFKQTIIPDNETNTVDADTISRCFEQDARRYSRMLGNGVIE